MAADILSKALQVQFHRQTDSSIKVETHDLTAYQFQRVIRGLALQACSEPDQMESLSWLATELKSEEEFDRFYVEFLNKQPDLLEGQLFDD